MINLFKRREVYARSLTKGMKIKIGDTTATVDSVERMSGDSQMPPTFTSLANRTAVALQVSFLDHAPILLHPARNIPLA